MNKGNHQHKLGSGWIRGRQTYRECVLCRRVLKTYGNNQPEQVRSDYNYYKEMADYYGV